MTTSTAYCASVLQSGSPPSGINQKDSTAWGSGTLASWVNQSGGSIAANDFNLTSGDYASAGSMQSHASDTDSNALLLYNFAANWSPAIPSGATITAISGTMSRAEATSTNSGAALYDLCVWLWLYNGADLTSGGLGTNQAATAVEWAQSVTAGMGGVNQVYTFSPTTYANVTNSNLGVLIGVDGSQCSKACSATIGGFQLSVSWTAPGGALPPDDDRQGAFPGSSIALQGYRFVNRRLRRLRRCPRPFWQTLTDSICGGGMDAAPGRPPLGLV